MLGVTHALVGLAIGRSLGIFGLKSYFSILCIVFSMLPDMDQPSGVLSMLLRPISLWLHSRFGHRTLTHSAFALGLGCGLCGLFSTQMFLVFVFSYGAHIVLDMMTYSGVELFYPVNKKVNLLGGPLLTGGWCEIIISAIAVAWIIFLEVHG